MKINLSKKDVAVIIDALTFLGVQTSDNDDQNKIAKIENKLFDLIKPKKPIK